MWILSRKPVPTTAELDKYKAMAKTLLPEYDHENVVYTRQGDSCEAYY